MSVRFGSRPTTGVRGFTLVELLVVIVVGSLVVENAFRLVISQQRSYAKQREIVDLRANLRNAGTMLASELRGIGTDDIYSMSRDSISVRSIVGSALICRVIEVDGASTAEYVLAQDAGELLTAVGDSALVFTAGAAWLEDDAWTVLRTESVAAADSLTPRCHWGARPRKAYEIEFSGDTAGVVVGAPVYAFRRTQYGLFRNDGRWTLGRKVGSATSWEELTGPFVSPTAGGLVFSYFDSSGAVTSTPADVAIIEISLNGKTNRALWKDRPGGPPRVHKETYRTRVALRG